MCHFPVQKQEGEQAFDSLKREKNEPQNNTKKSSLTGEKMTANCHSQTVQGDFVISMNDTKKFFVIKTRSLVMQSRQCLRGLWQTIR
jgi:predicted transcriptional regulator